MSEWPIDDRLALMLGRVMLAWGNIDQQIYHAIQMMSATEGSTPTTENRFAHRLKELRSLMLRLSGGDKAFMAKYDSFQHQLKDVEQMRADMAHGIPFPKIGTVEFYTNRNPSKWRTLTVEQINALPDTIFELRQTLFRLKLEAQQLYAARHN